ncbi:response regulator transcription factor [Pseudomonas proteolytica]|uniref:response regulator transcription factor n=1 Tax=Pseudomonas proteolytica TaxID=219574 RepID=UPI001473DAE8|nr:response regulator transcription factor [Pseudomonas proteolytica]NMZ32850.1 response regulator transcription factor [Pseudomonas proteolytica]
MTRAIVVDDHPFIRSAVKMLLRKEKIDVVAEADNGVDAIRLVLEHHPDLIILDLNMPKLDGFGVIERINQLGLPAKVLVLTSQPQLSYSSRCMRAGAAGFISKASNLVELVKAINAVIGGYNYFPHLPSSSVRVSDELASDAKLISTLSNRELIVLRQLARGDSNKQISDNMVLSNKTISTYKTRVIEKLNLKSVVLLAEFARRNGLI